MKNTRKQNRKFRKLIHYIFPESEEKQELRPPLQPTLYYEPRDYAQDFEYPTQLGLGGKRK